ncbi:MAG: hypothetical protein ACXWX0_06895 [Actinomycetota bacterium]
MRMMKVAALVPALALALTACGGGGDGGVATLQDGAMGAQASASPSMSDEEALQAFAECMRENGVEDFQDPQVDDDGRITFGIGRAAGEDGGPPSGEDRGVMQDAMEACQDLLPQGLGGGPGGISAEDEAAFQDVMLEYAQCMRDHGVDMPDPDFSGGGGFIGMAEGADLDDPDFQAADEACRPILEEVRPDAPQP